MFKMISICSLHVKLIFEDYQQEYNEQKSKRVEKVVLFFFIKKTFFVSLFFLFLCCYLVLYNLKRKMKSTLLAATLLSLFGKLTNGDMYLQCIPGSNDRLDEPNRDRNNGNRLFDSQNNDRGGYNVGKMSYYFNEQVPVCWTNQHSSGRYGLRGTEIKFQYMCDALARDGTTTNTIPDDPRQCYNYDCDTDTEYGRHESFSYYQYCKASERNKGLFTANQNLNGYASIYTRQNPTGNRHGYECPEERDYYPWWRASPWRDIHIFTNNAERCDAYQTESQNVKSRWQCAFTSQYWTDVLKGYVKGNSLGMLPLNMTKCINSPTFVDPKDNQTYKIYQPQEVAAHGISAPGCTETIVTRDNHHGVPGTRNYWTYMWTVPDLSSDNFYTAADYSTCCVLRTTYNITTNDYPAWSDDYSINAGVDWRNNSEKKNPNPDTDPAQIRIWENFGLSKNDIIAAFNDRNRDGQRQKNARGYIFINNPRVDPFGLGPYNYTGGSSRIQLQLAINTNQFGRTFQDRTHCFSIHPRPSGIPASAKISLLTVQGKRGNIVQVYPATEYTFQPEPAQITRGDYVHFCWTGSNTEPNNNDGQGLAGTDRSNICPLNDQQYSKKLYSDIDGNYAKLGDYRGPGYNADSDNSNSINNRNYLSTGPAVGDLGNSYPAWLVEPEYAASEPKWYPYAQRRQVTKSAMGGLDIDTLSRLCTTRRVDQKYEQMDFGSMEEFDGAGTTTCIEPVQVTENGEWNFLCTRNNNFSNRSQKGTLIVSDSDTLLVAVTEKGGRFSNGAGSAIVVVPPGSVATGQSLQFSVTTWYKPGSDSSIVQISGPDGGAFSSSDLTQGGYIEIWIPYTAKGLNQPTVYYTSDLQSSSWGDSGEARVDYSQNTYYAVKDVNEGGYYKAVNHASWWQVLLLVVFGGLVFACFSFIIVKKCYLKK
ncbi:hypothetical protein RFI_31659 [Reticulomyxa filosa]|uniref:Uncharacterized protein n=1 Tax=Reticulomyxa filosa TaxID=46433 RepID=X6LWI9_RETFI|nr:hypothetical protein RFI_31659 [Reticulomyxa filosa]|eukprot:ETO05736.1 hypothetical protein RFI_31659 [Reticulomyxa filosa]